MHNLSRERYLKDLQQTLVRLLNFSSEIKEVLEHTNGKYQKEDDLLQLEQQLQQVKTEIARINYTLQIIKTK